MSDQSPPVTSYPAYPAAGHHRTTATVYPYVAPLPHPPTNPRHVLLRRRQPMLLQQPPTLTFVHRFFAFLIGSILITASSSGSSPIPRPNPDPNPLQCLIKLLTFRKLGRRVRRPEPEFHNTLYYDEIEAAIYYTSDSISETTVPPFVQGTKNETTLRAAFALLTAYIDGRDSINNERSHGTVDFNLRMMTRVRFQAGSWWARRRILRIYCPDLSVGVSAKVGSLVGGSKQCSVGL